MTLETCSQNGVNNLKVDEEQTISIFPKYVLTNYVLIIREEWGSSAVENMEDTTLIHYQREKPGCRQINIWCRLKDSTRRTQRCIYNSPAKDPDPSSNHE